MSSHIIDSDVYGATFASAEMAETFSDRSRVQRWFDVEAAHEIDRHLARGAEAEPRIFVGNITGAVGTMASFGAQGLDPSTYVGLARELVDRVVGRAAGA